jgi:CRP-like cAMP-binding protein
MTDDAAALKNQLLAALPPRDWEKMRPFFEPVELSMGKFLYDVGEPMRHLYFPTVGVISSVALFESASTAEMATVGREGMVSADAILGGETALSRTFVQVTGSALMVDLDVFKRFQREIPAFDEVLAAYVRALLAQVMQSVACNGVHFVEERAARWLLMCHDRSDGDSFPITQEFLAEMLGVSRPAVSMVARTLNRAGLIRYSRGIMKIEDRVGLEEACCECYSIIRQRYQACFANIPDRTTERHQKP